MVSFTINLGVMNRVGAQPNKTCTRRHEKKIKDTTPLKTNGSKMNIPFEKVNNFTSTS